MHWKRVFKRDLKEKIKQSSEEFKKYRKTDEIIYLQQACNKLFSAVENLLMYKYGKRYGSYQKIRSMVSKNRYDSKLLLDANKLHKFYYNAELFMDRYDAEIEYKLVLDRLKRRMKR